MAFLGKGRRADLSYIAEQLGERVTDDLKIIDLRNLIVNSTNYDEEFVREMLNARIEERLEGNTSRVSENDHISERHHSNTFELLKLLKFKAKQDDTTESGHGECDSDSQSAGKKKAEQKSISEANENDEIKLEENLAEDIENLLPSLKEEKDTMNLININTDEFIKAQQESQELALLIQKNVKNPLYNCRLTMFYMLPDFKRQFVLQTDASDTGIGIVLAQRNGRGEEHPILYLSKKFSDTEKVYCTNEKECEVIV
ncbi:uncharacterized protein TNIN_98861 [Trichonephila inaurata madagascariensis]|uniref:Reverse transcriptase/retrotransposon-derived protein RNase H-like domain-containing protein n=1 Tax=Trichonephila inaurata madagascariensis TaxID=2747483 RepID=A0A8X7BQG2_9ARAC|nr:uncharacterized protein TNIN_98861 [Trichonephila inaurata madagascariensis]